MKEKDVALVIFQAKAAISQACEGRACLPECLRAIERAASVETAVAPLVASGAKAAKRTPAEAAPPHGARLRVPVGAVRTAWRAFASFSRRARGLFRRICRGLAARLPAGARLVKAASSAVAITLGVTCLSLHAVVFCTWNGSEYVCSGEGDTVTVNGGGYYGDIVVTNIVGVCTNCVAMSPGYVRDWKSSALELIGSDDDTSGLMGDIHYVLFFSRDVQQNLSSYTNTYPVSRLSYLGSSYQILPNSAQIRNFLTNYVSSSWLPVGIAESVSGISYNDAAYTSSLTGSGTSWRQNFISAYDGAASAYNSFAPNAKASVYNAQDIERYGEQLHTGLLGLRSMVEQLSDEECTNQWDGASGGSGGEGSGGGSTIVTNQISGNWCTYDQGEAIKELLADIKKWEKDQISYLNAVSNYLSCIDSSIKSALFSRYTNIPSESNLGETWQDVYLAGQPTQWGYEPTNILQRIELLIYGMSGVGTNTTDVTEATGVDPDEADTAGDDAKDAIDELSVGDSAASADVRSIMDALTSFFNTFNGLTGDRFAGQAVLDGYSIDIGNEHIDVPALVIDQESSNMANVVQSACRAFLTCVYLLFAVFCGWRFYVLFLGAVVKYAKWAQELLSSLFAD